MIAPEKTETETEVVLTMSVYDKYGNPISDANVKMKTDLGTVTSPAESKGEGKYTATFSSGGKEGTAKITASIEGGPSKTAQLMVYKYPRIKEGDITPLIGKIGTTFTVTAQANISGNMTFSIGDIPGIQNHPMDEVSTGNYKGTYTVPTGVVIDVADALVTLSLEDDLGNLAELTLEQHVAIDNVPPPTPKNLQVEGGGISRENVSKAVVMASATPGRQVILTVTDISDGKKIGDFSSVAGNDGQVTWTLDTKNWTNEEVKEYRFEAAEAPDAVGNGGGIARLTVIRDIRPNTVLLFVRLSPSDISYKTDASLEITIGFTEKPPTSAEVKITLSPPITSEREYFLSLKPDKPGSLNFKADVLGYWEYNISWPGNADHRDAERTGSFEVGPGKAELSLEKKIDNVKPGQEILFTGQLMLPGQPASDELKNQPIKMQIQKPEVGAWEQVPGEFRTDKQGYFEASFIPDTDGVWQFRAVWDGLKDKNGQQLYNSAVSNVVEVTVIFPSGKVVIAVGGNSSESYWKETFLKLGRHVYDVFSRRGFPAENIRFLSPAPSEAPTDTLISRDALKDAVLNWGAKGLGPNENLYIYMLSDNLKDSGFILQSGVHGVERLDKSDVHDWLSELSDRKVNVVLVLESCYSGEYIQHVPAKKAEARRVFITSAEASKQADIIRTDSFTQRFFNRLDRRENFKSAFEETKKEMSFAHFRNTPQVDENSDGVSNNLEDIKALDGLFLGDPRIQMGDKPNITNWSEPRILAKGKHEATIEAFIKGGGVTASAVIFPPGHRDVAEVKSWEELEGITIELVGEENTGYRGTYDGFTEPGEYTILITAENIDGTAIPARTAVTVPGSLLLGDVNGDGKVKSNDAALALRIAAGLVEPTPEQILAADMNGDGKIRSNDAFAILRKAAGLGAPALDKPPTSFFPLNKGGQGVVKGELSSQAEKAVKISLSKVEGVADDNVRVQLTVDKPSAIGSADISIAYDPAILTATNVETDGNALWAVNLNSPGQIRLATANLEVSAEPVLATIYFKLLQGQNSRISERKTRIELQETQVFGFDTLTLTVTKITGEITSPLITPDRNLLGQNFPNPFNPETWIPFRLAENLEVKIRIYDIQGRLVRELALGGLEAGVYEQRDKAVHWDGRNEQGEQVASGVYIYQMVADKKTFTRRMVILK